ncbi:hypothetical protein NFC81_11130 [Salinispirillum sp. LH 10-3-1]|uniref:MarR family transcriptional regulator n=1 Tax=Salinispirillum sp. LH 10-3-1 TaxID=2952525 RepID=A0AB38YDV7_9GAMM
MNGNLHITDFYNDAGRVLILLYRSFPRLDTLWIDDVCGPDELDDFGQHSVRFRACSATVVWLRNEGYLRYSDQDGEKGFNHCVLTEKGLAVLSGWHLEGREMVIDQLERALDERSSSAMEQAVSGILKASARQYYGLHT